VVAVSQPKRPDPDQLTQPKRRSTDRQLFKWRENAYRDVWLFLITVVVVIAVVVAVRGSDKAKHGSEQARQAVAAQQQGRRLALRVSCAVESAIAEAGRAVILSSAKPPPSEEKALERLGFPPFKVRVKLQEKAADAYVAGISSRVERSIGNRGDRLVQPGGMLDCKAFLRLANASS
jgi:hypothetical protein